MGSHGRVPSVRAAPGCFGAITPPRPSRSGTGAARVGTRDALLVDRPDVRRDRGREVRPVERRALVVPDERVGVEFNYGYGRLNRAGLVGRTNFYQLRLQFQL